MRRMQLRLKLPAAIVDLGEKLIVVTGDVLLASAFVSYVGPFNKRFRDMISNGRFLDFFKKYKIPISPDTNPLTILTDEATISGWNNQKIPADRLSTENGAILTSSERYSLIIPTTPLVGAFVTKPLVAID